MADSKKRLRGQRTGTARATRGKTDTRALKKKKKKTQPKAVAPAKKRSKPASKPGPSKGSKGRAQHRPKATGYGAKRGGAKGARGSAPVKRRSSTVVRVAPGKKRPAAKGKGLPAKGKRPAAKRVSPPKKRAISHRGAKGSRGRAQRPSFAELFAKASVWDRRRVRKAMREETKRRDRQKERDRKRRYVLGVTLAELWELATTHPHVRRYDLGNFRVEERKIVGNDPAGDKWRFYTVTTDNDMSGFWTPVESFINLGTVHTPDPVEGYEQLQDPGVEYEDEWPFDLFDTADDVA